MTERSLQLCCTGRESLVRRRVCSITPMTDGGLTLRPKGAEALPHQKGEPRPTLNRQGYSRRGLTHRMEGSHATEGSQRLCCTGRKSLVRRRVRSSNDRRRADPATEGSRGSAAPEGEPRPMLKMQRDATDGGTLTASEGSLRLYCTGRESPLFFR